MGPSTAIAGPSQGIVERLNGGVSNPLLPSRRPYTQTSCETDILRPSNVYLFNINNLRA